MIRRDGPSLREVTAGPGWYPLVILTTLNVVDELDRGILAVFAPEIKSYFDINDTMLGAVVGIQVALTIIAAVPIGYLATRVDRARMLRWSAAAWTVVSAATALCVRLPAFLIVRLFAGIGRAAVEPVGKAMLADTYPPTGWNRVFAVHNAANPVGGLLGPLLAAIIGVFVAGNGVWRVAFPVLAIPTVITIIAARRFRETDQQMAKQFIGGTTTITGAPKGSGFRDSVGQLTCIPTFRALVVGVGVLGFALVGVLPFASLLYEEEYGVGEGGRGIILAVLATANLVGTLAGGPIGEKLFAQSPRRSTNLVGVGISAFCLALAVSVQFKSIVVVVALQWLAVLCVSVTTAPLTSVLSAISPPRLRPLMFSLLGFCIALFGGIFGAVLVGAISDATNIKTALTCTLPFGVAGGLLMARAAKHVDADIAAAGA